MRECDQAGEQQMVRRVAPDVTVVVDTVCARHAGTAAALGYRVPGPAR